MMHINNLSLIRQKKVLLHPTSFIIEPNKLYALIGHNGSGKSSLIKAMAGEMTPTQGGIEIEIQICEVFLLKDWPRILPIYRKTYLMRALLQSMSL